MARAGREGERKRGGWLELPWGISAWLREAGDWRDLPALERMGL